MFAQTGMNHRNTYTIGGCSALRPTGPSLPRRGRPSSLVRDPRRTVLLSIATTRNPSPPSTSWCCEPAQHEVRRHLREWHFQSGLL